MKSVLYSRSNRSSCRSPSTHSNFDTGQERFGESVALSSDGNILAVGAIYADSEATGINGQQINYVELQSGAVYVYMRETMGQWSPNAYVKASNTEANDHFGSSVSLSRDGQILAIGAPGEGSNAIHIGGDQADNSASQSGAVYLY